MLKVLHISLSVSNLRVFPNKENRDTILKLHLDKMAKTLYKINIS